MTTDPARIIGQMTGIFSLKCGSITSFLLMNAKTGVYFSQDPHCVQKQNKTKNPSMLTVPKTSLNIVVS